ncbi:solute carrier family 22 member 7-like [Aplysia californica]|uniref:Solute carrier family 22 member 7-like n=1 Tax=Aplysia californica TaxID=6500 RepID=A0ABM1VZB1_APLCA|nr:solute carrier family 22 member 7-like [Aplysia californica]
MAGCTFSAVMHAEGMNSCDKIIMDKCDRELGGRGMEEENETPSVDVLVEKSGGCGKYQIFIVFSTLTGKFFIVWGFLGDSIGRKKTLFGSNFLCCVFSVVAIFSVNWEMFAAVRALIGATIGSHLAVVFPYPMEFVPRTHRSLLCAIPTWNLGTAAFAILVWTLKDWRYIHVATAITMGLCSIGYL